MQGRYREAARQGDEAQEYSLKSTHPMRLTFLKRFRITFLYDEKRYDESIEAIDDYIKSSEDLDVEIPVPVEATIYMYRGLNAIAKGDLAAARAALEDMRSLASSPTFDKRSGLSRTVRRMPTLLEAEVMLAEGRPAEAIAFMASEDTMYTPTLVYGEAGYYNLPLQQDVVARAYVALGDNGSAIREYERMLTIDPSNADRRMRVPVYHYRLAVLQEKEGQYDLAAKNYERYLEYMKRADEGISEVEDAKRRLEKLRRSSSLIRSSSSPRISVETLSLYQRPS
jgi:tetratricopeptide (TPR) repeat protein